MSYGLGRHPALVFCLSAIFSENRLPLFRIMLQPRSPRTPSAAPHPSTPAILRRRRDVRLGVLDLRLVSFDADNRQDDHCRGLFGTATSAEAHSASVIGKFENGTHFRGPAIVRALTAANPSADAPKSALSQLSPMQG